MAVLMTGRDAADRTVHGRWSVRRAPARGGRAALEVYEDGELVDVLVASALVAASPDGLLRGARRGTDGTFAWGRLGADGAAPQVLVADRRLRPHWLPARVSLVPGGFWWAHLPEPGVAVVARRADGAVGRLRPSRVG
ncbi:hypothetical protein ACFW1A_26645 [Kitasatospora sp. NPDC058965]|uniref:hypothetical protein n=1 Tax=Kitasatospora sp. NPDC058965 TaxID=3346682 RepID=UPI0036B088D1